MADKIWPSTVPTALHQDCCLAYDDDSSCESVFTVIASNEHVKALLERLKSHRNKRLLIGDVKKEAYISLTRRKEVSTKSEELALAFKEKGNTFYGSKYFLPALVCYDKVHTAPSLKIYSHW